MRSRNYDLIVGIGLIVLAAVINTRWVALGHAVLGGIWIGLWWADKGPVLRSRRALASLFGRD